MNLHRVIAYIDGFNLYRGMRDARLDTCRWLDLPLLCDNLLLPDQKLELTRYFTTRVRGNQSAHARQATYIDALLARGVIEIDFGHFLAKTRQCRSCDNSWQQNEEKKTDVNIAVRMLDDAYDDRFDVAIVMSGDSDLVPPVQSIKNRFPEKRIIAAFPPKRHSSELRRVAHGCFTISDAKVRQSRMPNPVTTADGRVLRAPAGWLPRGT